jgi:hypothetical protein
VEGRNLRQGDSAVEGRILRKGDSRVSVCEGVWVNVFTSVFRNFGPVFRKFGLSRIVRGISGAKTCKAVVFVDCGVCVPVFGLFRLSRISGVKVCEAVVLAESGTSSRIFQSRLGVTNIAETWESNSCSSRLPSSAIDAWSLMRQFQLARV